MREIARSSSANVWTASTRPWRLTLDVHIILENYATHQTSLIRRWFNRHPRSTRSLREAIREYIELSNTTPRPFVWTKTAHEILESVARFCKRVPESRHEREGPTDRSLFHTGNRVFHPAGAPAVRIRFDIQDGRAVSVTVEDGPVVVTGKRA